MAKIIQKIGKINFIASVIVSLAMTSCATIAVMVAPPKQRVQHKSPSAKILNRAFFAAMHSGDYELIPELLHRHKQEYIKNPGDAVTASHIGFLHIWALSERNRMATYPASVIDHASMCEKYFTEAVALSPEDPRLLGFKASCILAEASIHNDEASRREGYFMLHSARDAWPEFNNFTAGYVLSGQEHDSDLFQEGIDFQWSNLDDCTDGRFSKKTMDYSQFISEEITIGPKRACWDSWIAPHNFEGFFLNMGDMLVKKGDVETAIKLYSMAKLVKGYQKWPYRKVLEARINYAKDNVKNFRKKIPSGKRPDHPVIMFNSQFACMACHQKAQGLPEGIVLK
tara:strand:+ start:444 stop:1466 length:1023 start_codon:yes stop_codon:yes gene_type:complete